jgi:hypothetical protein
VEISRSEFSLLLPADGPGQLIVPATFASHPDILRLVAGGLLIERPHEHGEDVRAFELTAEGVQALLLRDAD